MSSIEYINSVVLAASTSEIIFSNIPSNYDTLELITRGGTTATATVAMQLNGDAGSTFSRTWLNGNGSSASSGRDSNGTQITVSAFYSNNNGLLINRLFGYSNTTTFTTVLSESLAPANFAEVAVGLWRSSSVVNSIKLFSSGGNFSSGSTFTLWGVK